MYMAPRRRTSLMAAANGEIRERLPERIEPSVRHFVTEHALEKLEEPVFVVLKSLKVR